MKVSAICYTTRHSTWIKLHLLLRESKMLNKQYVFRYDFYFVMTLFYIISFILFFFFLVKISNELKFEFPDLLTGHR